MDFLRTFNGDQSTKEEVIAFLHGFIAKEGLRRMYAKEEVSGIADAKDLVDKAFEELARMYAPSKPVEPETNHSR